MFKKLCLSVTVALSIALVPGSVNAFDGAPAEPDNSPVAQWVKLHGEENAAEIQQYLGREAHRIGVSPQELAQTLLDEYVAAQTGLVIKGVDGSEHPINDDRTQFKSASWFTGGSDSVELPKADRKGDFFYHDSSSWGYNHGHNGLYRWRGTVVEAANSDLGVIKTRIRNKSTGRLQRKVPKGTYILFRDYVSSGQRDTLTQWANGREGADYRAWWKTNRTAGAPYNCSQLVWAAYKKVGKELDPDDESRGTVNWYVYPSEIATGRHTYYYDRA